jgi:hypothetical protein
VEIADGTADGTAVEVAEGSDRAALNAPLSSRCSTGHDPRLLVPKVLLQEELFSILPGGAAPQLPWLTEELFSMLPEGAATQLP